MKSPAASGFRWVAALGACAVVAAGCASGAHKPPAAQAATPTTASSAPPATASQTTAAPLAAPTARGPAGGAPSGSALAARAVQDALAKGWAHININTTAPGHLAVYSQDSGPTAGHQVVTVDGSHAEVVLVGGVAYIRGDATAITSFFGYPATQVGRLANQWISLQATDPDYPTVIDAVTLGSALKEATIIGPATNVAETIAAGVKVIAITGAVPQSGGPNATGTLYISTGADPLPVQLVETASDGTKSTVTFGSWGTAVPLAAPNAAIPASSIPSSATA
jgi:hypothetical protein